MLNQYQSFNTRQEIARSVDALEHAVKSNPVAYDRIADKKNFGKQLAEEKERLEKMTPPDVGSETIPKLEGRIRQLSDAYVKGNANVPAMPNKRQMEQAPTGAIGQYATHERYWKDHTLDANGNVIKIDRKTQKGLVWELKDLLRMRHKEREYDDPDVANLDQFRPDGMNQVPLADSILPQSFGLSPTAKANYDAVFPDRTPTPVEAKIAEPSVSSSINMTSLMPDPGTGVRIFCAATKKNGKPCKSGPVQGKRFCVFHKNQEETP